MEKANTSFSPCDNLATIGTNVIYSHIIQGRHTVNVSAPVFLFRPKLHSLALHERNIVFVSQKRFKKICKRFAQKQWNVVRHSPSMCPFLCVEFGEEASQLQQHGHPAAVGVGTIWQPLYTTQHSRISFRPFIVLLTWVVTSFLFLKHCCKQRDTFRTAYCVVSGVELWKKTKRMQRNVLVQHQRSRSERPQQWLAGLLLQLLPDDPAEEIPED